MKKKITKYIMAVIIILYAMGIFLSKYSAVETRFECKGLITSNNTTQESTIYIILNRYRWWVGLWSNSYGDLKFEVPGKVLGYYTPVYEVGEQLQIYDGKKIAGHFSTLSHFLALKAPTGFFDGTCNTFLN